MSKKRHHMSKRQYKVCKKQHRQYGHRTEGEDHEEMMLSIKHGKHHHRNTLKHIQGVQASLEDFLDQEYDELLS